MCCMYVVILGEEEEIKEWTKTIKKLSTEFDPKEGYEGLVPKCLKRLVKH